MILFSDVQLNSLDKIFKLNIIMAGEVSEATMKNVFSVEEKILELVGEFSQGVTDKILLANMPTVDPKARAQVNC